MSDHLIDGEFQSDKYPTVPRKKVPLSVKDPDAQDLLWIYAKRHRPRDAEFTSDLERALLNAGYVPHGLLIETLAMAESVMEQERIRCTAILDMARHGEIDNDLRVIKQHIVDGYQPKPE